MGFIVTYSFEDFRCSLPLETMVGNLLIWVAFRVILWQQLYTLYDCVSSSITLLYHLCVLVFITPFFDHIDLVCEFGCTQH